MKTRFGDKGSTQVFQAIAKLESMDTSRLSSRNRIPWTAEEHTILLSPVPKCATWKEVYDGLEAEYPKGRGMATVRHCITKQNIDISQLSSPKPWTLEEDNVLREFFFILEFLDLSFLLVSRGSSALGASMARSERELND